MPTKNGNGWLAASADYTAVKTAYDSAKTGQTVLIPAGTSIWDTTLTITKSIVLKGLKSYSTRIVNNTFVNKSLIQISPPTDVPVRVTGIYFDLIDNTINDRSAILVSGDRSGKFGLTKIRIDHNIFNKGSRVVWWMGWAYGLTDHNTFINDDISVMVLGDDNYSWARPIVTGTENAVFIEHNKFVADSNYGSGHVDQFIYHQDGARSVTRYNIFDSRTYKQDFMFFDSHGNMPPEVRGQPLIEVYNDTFEAYKTWNFSDFRGGSILVHDNTISTISGSEPQRIALWEEEGWTSGGMFCPVQSCPVFTKWPAKDQINNSFYWNNTYNGILDTLISYNAATDTIFIHKNRDFFLHAPAASGGYEYWTGSPGDTTMKFKSGANLYYPYKIAPPHSLYSLPLPFGEGVK